MINQFKPLDFPKISMDLFFNDEFVASLDHLQFIQFKIWLIYGNYQDGYYLKINPSNYHLFSKIDNIDDVKFKICSSLFSIVVEELPKYWYNGVELQVFNEESSLLEKLREVKHAKLKQKLENKTIGVVGHIPSRTSIITKDSIKELKPINLEMLMPISDFTLCEMPKNRRERRQRQRHINKQSKTKSKSKKK